MKHQETDNKTIKTINSVYFIILCFLSLYLGKYRCVFFDGADWIYEIVAHKNNYFPHFRFAVAINGIIPWIVCHFTTTMNYIIWSFIINYTLVPLLIFIYLRYYIKDEILVLLFLISTSLFYTTVFFHPNHDIFCGYFYLILLYSVFNNHEKFKHYSAICIFLIFLIAFTNIIQLISLILILIYLWIKKKKPKNYNLLIVCIVSFALLKTIFFSSGYEKGVMSNILDFKSRFISIFSSNLFISYLHSLLNINFAATIVLAITIYVVLRSKQPMLALLFISEFLGIVLFTSFFFGYYPYCFGTEGYIKTSSLLISIIFIDSFIQSEKYSSVKKYIAIISIYFITIFFILLNSFNYKEYYNNINKIAGNLTENTIFVSDTVYKGEHYFTLPRESAIINLYENNNCFYFAYSKDSISWKNHTFPKDKNESTFCFNDKHIIKQTNKEIKDKLNNGYALLFELTDLKRLNQH